MPDSRIHFWLVLTVGAIAFLATASSPPSLLDDVDATYAQIARQVLESGDWVTAKLNGVPYFDKPPGQVWAMALSFAVLGTSDWAARVPMALAAIALCWLAWRTGRWAFGDAGGLYAGIGLATCCGLFLFTRVRIPDVYVACTSMFVLDSFLRAQEDCDGSARTRMRWAGAAVGAGMLFKGLVAAVLPMGAIATYLCATGQWRSPTAWRRLDPIGAATAAAVVAAPWHVLAILQHPPVFDFSLESGPDQYRGFFWRYFVNEHLLRYLGLRYPADYDRVPLPWFWAGHLVWLFPWSGMLAGWRQMRFGAGDRACRARLLMLCHCGFTLAFFSASTSQEYYTLPAYAPAMLLLASTAVCAPHSVLIAARIAASTFAVALVVGCAVLLTVWNLPAQGDISSALSSNPDAYTLSMGHLQDLTLGAFAYLRVPLALALCAFALGAVGGWTLARNRALVALACATVLLFHAAHWAMRAFDPYLSSRTIAEAISKEPFGPLVLDQEYYAFSSIPFYTNRQVLLLNGRKNNIEYGSNAPGAPDVFLDDAGLALLWSGPGHAYLVTYSRDRKRFADLLGRDQIRIILESGDKTLMAKAFPDRYELPVPAPPATGRAHQTRAILELPLRSDRDSGQHPGERRSVEQEDQR